MSIQLANYAGKSFVSDCIKLATYSQYSHSAALFTQDMEVQVDGKTHFIAAGSVIEAWQGGVKLASSLSENHSPGTRVDLLEFKKHLTPEQEQRMAAFLVRRIGQKYAYLNVIRFLPVVRLIMPQPLPIRYNRRHVFCSELVLESTIDAGTPLLERCNPWEVPPRDLPRSPLVYLLKTVYTQ